MMHRAWIFLLFSLISVGLSLPASLMEDAKKVDQVIKPKSKRTQETLMFGNQQAQQVANAPGNSFTSNAEKRTLASSGLDGLKAALTKDDKLSSYSKSPSNSMQEIYSSPYDYSKVLVNEVEEEDRPRLWGVPLYSRYYMNEDRRKRSEKSIENARPTSTLQPSTSSFQVSMPTQQTMQAQAKRSVPYYQEPRYKRELPLDMDPEDVWTLLSLWENERHNGNWRKYANEEYDNMVENGLFDEEDGTRNGLPWINMPMYPSRHYGVDTLSSSDIGVVRTHPPSYYEQYGNQLEQYGGTAQYGSPQYTNSQYGLVYPQRAYYPQEKRVVAPKKRTLSYDPYSAVQLLGSQSRNYQYPHHVVY